MTTKKNNEIFTNAKNLLVVRPIKECGQWVVLVEEGANIVDRYGFATKAEATAKYNELAEKFASAK